jgi:hypothetical protein
MTNTRCQYCNGTGQRQVFDSAHINSCDHCDGTGEVSPLLLHSANAQHLKRFVRSPFAFPGAYALIAVMDDGECLCHDCTRKNFREILHATKTADRCGWNFQDVTINYEDSSLYCAHCDEPMSPEYCDHEQECIITA